MIHTGYEIQPISVMILVRLIVMDAMDSGVSTGRKTGKKNI